MISLPISLPTGFDPLVKVGDKVVKGQILATPLDPGKKKEKSSKVDIREVAIPVAENFGVHPAKSGRFLLKNPGDSIEVGEVIAVKGDGLSLTKIKLVSQLKGTVLRFERSSGQLIVQVVQELKDKVDNLVPDKVEPILSPLDGKVSVCNNETIVLESESDSVAGSKGTGGKIVGTLSIDLWEKASLDDPISAPKITKDFIDKIILVPAITREALVKADAIGVNGILTTFISDRDLEYVSVKHKSLVVLEIGEDVAKKLLKTKASQLVLDGQTKTIAESI